MKHLAYVFSIICITTFLHVLGANAGEENNCSRCTIVREYNESHPENNYEFYDDYLKDKENNVEKTSKANEELENPFNDSN